MTSPPGSAAAVVLAAGRSERLAGAVPKPFLALAGRRVIDHSLAAFGEAPSVGSIVVVVPESLRRKVEGGIAAAPKVVAVVAGGATRQESLAHGLAALAALPAGGAAVIAVHDAARPLLTPPLIEEVVAAVSGEFDGAISAIPLDDAIKEVEDGGGILGPRSRVGLWRAQTPQAFRRDCIESAVKQALADGVVCDDCSEMATRLGYRVRVVAGSTHNVKITRTGDIELCEALLTAKSGARPGRLT
jgi:2-C-methyl-D-erythritol 4-phosphate cytidylyltransferase